MLWPLEDAAERPVEEVGGKARALGRLARAGLPVPPGLVVGASALLAALDAAGLARRWRRGRLRPEEVEALVLPPELAGALRSAAARLGPRLAVRSSAADEDARAGSAAGQYRTVLGVGPGDALEAAVRACWASALSPRARAWRAARGRAGGTAPVAVLVQPLVEARAAGVLFTVDPMSGSWREMVVEAAWGLGAAVVDGRIPPDRYRVRRPRRTPAPVQRVLARLRLEVAERDVRRQEERWTAVDGRLVRRPVPPALVDRPKLDDAALLRLCRLGLRAEALLGGPQDVEWALDKEGRLHLLQARPITAVARAPRRGGVVWTRRFLGERWTEPATPLGWSEVQPLLHHFIAYPETSRRHLGGEPPTRLVRFAPYLNATVFRHLAFKLPGMPPPRFMVELLPPEEEAEWLRARARPPDLAVYASILRETFRERRWRRFRWNPLTNWRAWARFEAGLDARLAAIPARARGAAALDALDACRSLARDYVKIHVTSLLFANVLYELSASALPPDLRGVLLRAPGGNRTVATHQALWELGRGERALDSVLAGFGHRSPCSWELFAPRWAEAPALVRSLAEVAAAAPDAPRTVALRAEERARAALAGLAPGTRALVRLARRYLALREDQRFHFDRILWRWKRLWLGLEEEAGLPLRFLERAEAEALVRGELDRGVADELVRRRRAAWAEERARRARGDEPPAFLRGAPAPAASGGGGCPLRGRAVAAGVATGPVRVLRGLDEAARLRPGDVLVARATDPGWTPLFLRASGVVLEMGGLLSHAAVIAREYGIPAVSDVEGATRRLRDGQSVTVDGNRGLVWVR